MSSAKSPRKRASDPRPAVLPRDSDCQDQYDEEEAVFTPVGIFRLVHLDSPDADTIARRVADFDPQEFFSLDCPLCRKILEEGGDVVYNGSEVEEIDLL
ncbi:MAG TPA: hypothetical protein VLU25_18520 [Acidobacteriota bacterium]|nr:hypothetical protein [Acidobacteriota bacterium]